MHWTIIQTGVPYKNCYAFVSEHTHTHTSFSHTWYTAASRLLSATKAMLFWTAYTTEGTLSFSSSLGLKMFSTMLLLSLMKLPDSLKKSKPNKDLVISQFKVQEVHVRHFNERQLMNLVCRPCLGSDVKLFYCFYCVRKKQTELVLLPSGFYALKRTVKAKGADMIKLKFNS